jgi:hypothetical protein
MCRRNSLWELAGVPGAPCFFEDMALEVVTI